MIKGAVIQYRIWETHVGEWRGWFLFGWPIIVIQTSVKPLRKP